MDELFKTDGILEKVRKINWILQESPKGNFSYDGLCHVLSDLTNANVYLMDESGMVLGVDYKIASDKSTVTDELTGIDILPMEYNVELMKLTDTMMNLRYEEILRIFKNDQDTQDKFHTLIPIVCGGNRLGTLMITRYDEEFTEEDLVLAEVGATVIGLEIQRVRNLQEEDRQRNIDVVKMAINTLSYSEHEAVVKMFEELDGDEGILIASKIADESRITRSVIVNALRKLESAGVINSKSLGMKGTHIKVINPEFYQQLELSK